METIIEIVFESKNLQIKKGYRILKNDLNKYEGEIELMKRNNKLIEEFLILIACFEE